MSAEIKSIIRSFLEKNRELLGIDESIVLDDELILYGEKGILDSLHLVHFVVGVEKELQKNGHKNVILSSSKAFSYHVSPFKSITNLAKFVEASS